ncbi:hypothetical protein ACIQZG_08615 [Lysinibacillus sp. NPDC096418]|uniref:hypothetical protein n=1 Tax=Lysinibacillus sp. NPDC096418 TaxID=3364138 RepID=UPI0038264B54
MEDNKKISTVSKIVGALVESEANASEASEILERAKRTFLERCWHVSSNKNSPQVARTTSEGGKIKGITIHATNHDIQPTKTKQRSLKRLLKNLFRLS